MTSRRRSSSHMNQRDWGGSSFAMQTLMIDRAHVLDEAGGAASALYSARHAGDVKLRVRVRAILKAGAGSVDFNGFEA